MNTEIPGALSRLTADLALLNVISRARGAHIDIAHTPEHPDFATFGEWRPAREHWRNS